MRPSMFKFLSASQHFPRGHLFFKRLSSETFFRGDTLFFMDVGAENDLGGHQSFARKMT